MKRIISHLKENWIKHVFETLVVVVGVMIAFSLNTWNQNRIKSNEEQRLLTAISEEMQMLRFQQNNGTKKYEDVKVAVQRLLSTINDASSLKSSELIDLDIYTLTNRWLMGKSNSTTTYDALIGSGEFGLISSTELRNLLAGLKLQIELLATYEDFQTNFVDNQLSPLLNQYVDGLSVLETGSEKMQDRYATPPTSLDSSIVSNRFTTSYQELLHDKVFSNQLVELYKHTESLTKIYNRIFNLISSIDSILVVENPSLKGDPISYE